MKNVCKATEGTQGIHRLHSGVRRWHDGYELWAKPPTVKCDTVLGVAEPPRAGADVLHSMLNVDLGYRYSLFQYAHVCDLWNSWMVFWLHISYSEKKANEPALQYVAGVLIPAHCMYLHRYSYGQLHANIHNRVISMENNWRGLHFQQWSCFVSIYNRQTIAARMKCPKDVCKQTSDLCVREWSNLSEQWECLEQTEEKSRVPERPFTYVVMKCVEQMQEKPTASLSAVRSSGVLSRRKTSRVRWARGASPN